MNDKIEDNWYETFFQGINCEVWENALPAEWTAQEVDFILEKLNVHPGHQLLDIPCGFGRHAIELSKRGFKVTGVDISKTFIDGLTEKISSQKLNIEAIEADVLSVQLDGTYAGAICMGNSFGYFHFDHMKLFVEKVSHSLEAGAKFIINSGMIAESILPNLQTYAKNKVYTIGNITMEVTNTYHAEDSFMTSQLLYTKDGKTEQHAFKHYVFTLGEVRRLLQSCGLRTVATYSTTSKEPFKLGDQQIYIETVKE